MCFLYFSPKHSADCDIFCKTLLIIMQMRVTIHMFCFTLCGIQICTWIFLEGRNVRVGLVWYKDNINYLKLTVTNQPSSEPGSAAGPGCPDLPGQGCVHQSLCSGWYQTKAFPWSVTLCVYKLKCYREWHKVTLVILWLSWKNVFVASKGNKVYLCV